MDAYFSKPRFACFVKMVIHDVVQEIMKTILAIFLATASASLASDVESKVHSATNGNNVVCTQSFTRDGITNLVCKTYTSSGKVSGVIQHVYYQGNIALELWKMEDGLTASAHSIPGVKIGTHFTPDGVLDHVNLMTTNVITLDHFTVTNGFLYPISGEDLRKANAISKDVGELFRSVTNIPPEEFKERAVDLNKKHKAK